MIKLVYNTNGVTKILSTKEIFQEHKTRNKNSEMVKFLEEKTIHELLQIATKDMNRYHRILAIHLLGKKKEKREKIKCVLREVIDYEHFSVRNEAIWALARLDDLKVQTSLMEIYKTHKMDIEKTLTVKLLGKIGDEKVIQFLLNVCVTSDSITRLSAGASIHEIIDRNGVEPLLNELNNKNPKIRQEAIWILSARCKFVCKIKEKKLIIEVLKNRMTIDQSIQVRLTIAYNLSLLDIPEGSKELLLMFISKEIESERQAFFLNEVIRAFVYRQKKSSLKLVNKLNLILENSEGFEKDIKASKVISKIENSIKNFDKIFDIIF